MYHDTVLVCIDCSIGYCLYAVEYVSITFHIATGWFPWPCLEQSEYLEVNRITISFVLSIPHTSFYK